MIFGKWFSIVGFIFLFCVPGYGQQYELTSGNFSSWCDRIQTKDSQMRWADLPWLTSFHEGLLEASKENKPLLLWVMNGHPHGCT